MSENLNHWTFVIAAYALSVAGTALLIAQSWIAMRRAEARRERSREQ
jgi:heme exporter protein D